MPEYKITVLTDANTAGLQQTQQATDKTTKAVKDLNAEMAKATQGYKDAQAPAVANATATTKTAEAADKASGGFRRLTGAADRLRQAFPALGTAIGGIANIWTALAGAIVLTFNKIKEWDAVIANNAARLKVFQDLNKEVDRFRGNLEKAKAEFVAFQKQFEKAGDDGETPSEEGERALAAAQAGFAGRRAKLGASKEAALARIARQEAAGQITPGQADAQRQALGASTDKQLQGIDLEEKKELSDIRLLVGSGERARAEELARQVPGAQARMVGAQNKRDDAQRALQAAMSFGGFDADMNPVAGGRADEIMKEMGGLAYPHSRDRARRDQLQGEFDSLRVGVLTRRNIIGPLSADATAAEEEFGRVRSEAIGAAGAARGLRRQGLAGAADFDASAGLAGELAPLRDVAARENANAASFKEAARQQAETAKLMREILSSLGQGLSETARLKQQVDQLQSRDRSALQQQ